MRYIVLGGVSFGLPMAMIWSVIFSNILGRAGIGIGVVLGASFGICGGLFGYAIKKSKDNKK